MRLKNAIEARAMTSTETWQEMFRGLKNIIIRIDWHEFTIGKGRRFPAFQVFAKIFGGSKDGSTCDLEQGETRSFRTKEEVEALFQSILIRPTAWPNVRVEISQFKDVALRGGLWHQNDRRLTLMWHVNGALHSVILCSAGG